MRLTWHETLKGSTRFKAAFVALGLVAAPCAVQAAVPTTTSIEGTLFSSGGGPAADGNYNVVFSIYKDASGGTAVYSEGPVAVAVKGGLFTYQIGSKTALTPAALAALPTAFLGIKIDQDAELPRQAINSTPFALRAGLAEGVDCTGCIAEKALDPNILKDYTKTAAMTAVAKSGNYADLTGAPTIPVVSAAGKSGNYADLLNLPTLANVAKTGNYADLIGAPTLGKVATTNKYADLTGLPTLAAINSSCGTGLAVKGIKADGTLDCAAAGGGPVDVKNLPTDGIDEISNGLIFNQFNDTFSGVAGTKIPDNNPIGISDTIDYPDIGLSQKLTVTIDVANSDISGLTLSLFDPAGVEHVLYKKGGTGTAVKTSYPAPTTPVSGDLTTWVGKNPKGKWIIKAVDTAFLNNAFDGAINSWSITSQTLSNKKIAVAGDINVAGNVNIAGNINLVGKLLGIEIPKPATYRWAAFNTYQENGEGWMMGNDAAFFGGVAPSTWTNGNGTAGSLSADKEVLRMLFVNKGYAKWNANCWSEIFIQWSSTNSRVYMALFRVRNNTTSDIAWTPNYKYTSWSGWGEYASAALNGTNVWTGDCDYSTCNAAPKITIPKKRVSTVIFQVTASHNATPGYDFHSRKSVLAFYNNTLKLPDGLEFIDDLDSAGGGWEQ